MNETTVRRIVKEETADIRQETRYNSVMLEDLRGTVQAILENVTDRRTAPQRLDQIADRIEHLENDIDVVKNVVKSHSSDIAELKSH